MTTVHYEETATMREALRQYFLANNFGEFGNYDEAWVDLKLGPIPIPFPNSPARVRAVRFHDLHHLLTGYDTDWYGEFEISAWELGAGCGSQTFAWGINLMGLAASVVVCPLRGFRAFVRGRRSVSSLYDIDYESLLDKTVGEVRQMMKVPQQPGPWTISDVVYFKLAALAGYAIGVPTVFVLTPMIPFGVAYLREKKRKEATSQKT